MAKLFCTLLMLSVSLGYVLSVDICENQRNGERLAHPADCRKFVVCQNGESDHILNCPLGQHFNRFVGSCDFKENAECERKYVHPIAKTIDECSDCCDICCGITVTPTPTPDTTEATPTPTPDTTEATPTPGIPGTGPSGTTCNQSGQCAGQVDGVMFANPATTGYIVCQCECEIERPCPDGTSFNEDLQTCDHLSVDGGETITIVCDNDSSVCTGQDDGSLFSVDGVCNKFYKCNFGCAVEIECPNNLIYDPSSQMCDYPQNYDCPWPYTPPSGPSAGPSGIACASGGRCVGENEGTFFTSLTSCSNYVVCQCECEVEMSCPDGLYWDSQSSICNYSTNVTCTL